MSNLFGIFIVLYFVFLVIHGSIYSSTMQAIGRLRRTFNVKGVNKKKIQAKINNKMQSVKRMKTVTWIIYCILFILHLTFISRQEFPEDDAYTNAIYLFVGVSALLFVMNWLKGAGTIDKNARFSETIYRR